MVSSLATIEAAVRAAVYERLGEGRFSRWFGDEVEFDLSVDSNALEVRTPCTYFREWIENHYRTVLIEAVEAVTGRRVDLTIRVYEKTEPTAWNSIDSAFHRNKPKTDQEQITRSMDSAPNSPEGEFAIRLQASNDPGCSVPVGRAFVSEIDRSRSSVPLQTAISRAVFSARRSQDRPTRRLEDFVTGSNNHLAHAASCEMGKSAGAVFNPLVIHGATGLGKTHLLEGITHSLNLSHPKIQIIQLTAEAFTNGFLQSMQTGSLHGFRARFRNAGALIVDDIHFLAAKRATMAEFLRTFDTLVDKGAPIVLSADQHPRLICRLTSELVTRFLSGMIVKIEYPDVMTRQAILRRFAATHGVHVPEVVIVFIAEYVHGSIRELKGALHTVVAHADLTGKQLDLNLVKAALRDTIRHSTPHAALSDLEHIICQRFQISVEALKSDSRARALAYPRMLAMYLARKHTTAAYSEIGRHFGDRKYSTVIAAEKKVKLWLREEEQNALLPGFETISNILADLERSLGTETSAK
jgi:chromosomal replication initiator protein